MRILGMLVGKEARIQALEQERKMLELKIKNAQLKQELKKVEEVDR